MFRLPLRLSQKLTFIYVLFAAGLLAFVGVLAYSSGRSGLEAATNSALLSTVTEKAAALDAWVNARQATLTVLTSSGDVIEDATALTQAAPGSPAAQDAHDQLLSELRPSRGTGIGILALLVMDSRTGQVLAATDSADEGTSRAQEPYFINGKVGPYIQNPRYSGKLKEPGMTISMPLRDSGGRLIAVTAADLNLDLLDTIVARRSGVQQTDDAYLVNMENLFVTPPRFLSDPAALQSGIHTDTVNNCL